MKCKFVSFPGELRFLTFSWLSNFVPLGSETVLLGSSKGTSSQGVQPDVVASCLKSVDSTAVVINKAISGEPDVASDELPSCYKPPWSAEKMDLLLRKTFSDNTNSKINWAVNLYRDWFFKRCKSADCNSQIK